MEKHTHTVIITSSTCFPNQHIGQPTYCRHTSTQEKMQYTFNLCQYFYKSRHQVWSNEQLDKIVKMHKQQSKATGLHHSEHLLSLQRLKVTLTAPVHLRVELKKNIHLHSLHVLKNSAKPSVTRYPMASGGIFICINSFLIVINEEIRWSHRGDEERNDATEVKQSDSRWLLQLSHCHSE